jgi:hypothetical protein
VPLPALAIPEGEPAWKGPFILLVLSRVMGTVLVAAVAVQKVAEVALLLVFTFCGWPK